MIKRSGYNNEKVPLYYIESLMSKNNFYTETTEIEYAEFLMLIFRVSVE
jgi:hypothetical protein